MKRTIKSFSALVMCLVLVIGLLTPVHGKAASNPLNATNLYFGYKNLTFTLTGVKNATYSSSNKKVATVSSKGVVTSTGKGECNIYAKKGTKKYKCHVTVSGKGKLTIRTKDNYLRTGIGGHFDRCEYECLRDLLEIRYGYKLPETLEVNESAFVSSNPKIITTRNQMWCGIPTYMIRFGAEGTSIVTLNTGEKTSYVFKVKVDNESSMVWDIMNQKTTILPGSSEYFKENTTAWKVFSKDSDGAENFLQKPLPNGIKKGDSPERVKRLMGMGRYSWDGYNPDNYFYGDYYDKEKDELVEFRGYGKLTYIPTIVDNGKHIHVILNFFFDENDKLVIVDFTP